LLSEQGLGKEGFKGNLHILKRVATVIVIMMILDAAGLGIFFYVQGQLQYPVFMQSLILLLLLEGCFIGAAGGFMYIGLGAVRAAREATRNPAVTEKQKKVWKERQESRDQWSFAMITAGLLMILVGFVMSTIFQI
jgi:hypothetical protein